MVFCDAHLHLTQCTEHCEIGDVYPPESQFFVCSCAHSVAEFEEQEQLCARLRSSPDNSRVLVVQSFGMHPQEPLVQNEAFLTELLERKRIAAIGETGFDFFTEQYRADRVRQEAVWRFQCEAAIHFGVPIVVHNRKALDLMFRDRTVLQKIPGVLFHSFAFGMREAQSLLDHGIDAYFSFGKQMLNGNKKAMECVEKLPADRLLLETDAPFQTLKGELCTDPRDIVRVYQAAAELRDCSLDALCGQCSSNFNCLFLKSELVRPNE